MNELIARLVKGNEQYLSSLNTIGDISLSKRKDTATNGQHPFVVIITCSDSRVIPEAIFNLGIGEAFIIRVAGNVVGECELGSIEYAIDHLGCKLVLVLGHTHCGAIHSAISNGHGKYVEYLLNPIKSAIKNEKDELKASEINAINSSNIIRNNLNNPHVEVASAIYDIETGKVKIL